MKIGYYRISTEDQNPDLQLTVLKRAGVPPPLRFSSNSPMRAGFTLIELSISLVIIGLIVGGILLGMDLIKAAEIRAQISQIQKYQTAVNTFRIKYNNSLPGDMTADNAAAYGFSARSGSAGQGDGNGVLQSSEDGGGIWGFSGGAGENAVFWEDLSAANLIDGNFTTATMSDPGSNVSGDALYNYFPAAKIGGGNKVHAWSRDHIIGGQWVTMNANYFGITNINFISSADSSIRSTPGLSVQQAYAIDTKMDDGLPQSGNVTAEFIPSNTTASWAGATPCSQGTPCTTAAPGSTSTCFDNNNSDGVTPTYSTRFNSGSSINCALSFLMK